MRLSKRKGELKGSLKGLSSKEFYAVTSLKNPLGAIRPIVGEELFKKFDRLKPLNDDQIRKIEEALNQVAFEHAKSLIPYTTPLVNIKRIVDRSSTKSIYSFSGISYLTLEKHKTPDGPGYLVCDNTIKHGDFEGRVLFTKHAIDRLIEREPHLIDLSKKDTGIIIKVMRRAISDGKVGMGSVGPQLKCGPLGFFPMLWEKSIGMWMLTTFLEKDMRGTTDQVIKKIKSDWEELAQKYDVQRPTGK